MAAQALVEQHEQQLADLKLEASILRQASTEHARHALALLLLHVADIMPVPSTCLWHSGVVQHNTTCVGLWLHRILLV